MPAGSSPSKLSERSFRLGLFQPPPSKLRSGLIRADELYTLPELRRRLGIRQAAWRVLRRKGLPFHQVCKRVPVFGQDFFEFVHKQGQPQESLRSIASRGCLPSFIGL
jgi:hypothetical protein